MAGCLAWPTTGAEVRPWFLFPQRWPLPPPGPLPVPRDPGCDPLSLHARLESISLFLSSDFIISFSSFFPATLLLFLSLLLVSLEKFFSECARVGSARKKTHPDREQVSDSLRRKFYLNVAFPRSTVSLRISALHCQESSECLSRP